MLVRITLRRLFVALLMAGIVALSWCGYRWLSAFEHDLVLHDASRYVRAEVHDSDLASRRAMVVAIELQKRLNLAPSSAARLYAYAASVYADSLEVGATPAHAFVATMDLLERIAPAEREMIRRARASEGRSVALLPPVRAIVEKHAARLEQDGYSLVWDPGQVPNEPAAWYLRGGAPDGGAASGSWKLWNLEGTTLPSVPAPPEPGSILDRLEIEKVRYATLARVPADAATIFLWHGASGFIKGSHPDNITPAGVWQNILFVEMGSALDDMEYARAQRLLAQGIADAFILTWREKYRYYTGRPSMRDETLLVALGDPPFPSYISGHSTISKAAAVILAELFPEKSDIWHQNALDARRTRLLGGIHFDIDNSRGEEYGRMIGAATTRAVLGSGPDMGTFSRPVPEMSAWLYLQTLRLVMATRSIAHYREWRWTQRLMSDIRFVDESQPRGVASPGTPFVVWFDADGDDQIDLFIRPGLFLNRNGIFADVTRTAFPEGTIGTGNISPTAAATGDIDGDGDEDIIITDHEYALLRVYSSRGDATFSDTTDLIGLRGTYPRGLALADFDGDRDLDIYVANWDDTSGTVPRQDRNELWLNDGTGKFQETPDSLGAMGWPECPNYPSDTYPQSLDKNAFQPVALDYDNDGDMDIFVATDTWISPLYRNDGGRFTDVTYESGLCVPGTGMGVALADVDGNGLTDIYVTNTGGNYLWMNSENGVFSEESVARGVANAGQGWGAHFADFDNDGDEDLYVVNGNKEAESVAEGNVDPRNVDAILQNDGGYFTDVTKASGVSGSWVKAASGIADVDGDGRMDVFVGGVLLPGGLSDPLYMNMTDTDASWLGVRLKGPPPNTSAIGARVTVRTSAMTLTRVVASGSSFHSQDSRWLHFGLGDAHIVEEVAVVWPDGRRTTLSDVKTDQMITVDQQFGIAAGPAQ